MAARRSKAEMRLVHSATAYKRLAWKQGTSQQQRDRWLKKADQLTRQADAIRARRERVA